MPLTLLAGPANAGKVSLLLDRYLAALDREPMLIVPGRPDVDRVEHDLLRRTGALLSGRIGTFDDVFELIAQDDPERRTVVSDVQRILIARRAIADAALQELDRSARFAGFTESLLQAIAELESGLVDLEAVDGDLARLYAAYRAELDRHRLWDRDLLRARAVVRLSSALDAWQGQPVFAYGFEDLTAAEWGLLEGLAARAEVTVSLPYEPGRAVFGSLERTAEDLARLAGGRIEELPPRYADVAHPALAFLERRLFEDSAPDGRPALDGAVRFLEGAGARGALELVGDEVLALIRAGTSPAAIGIVCASLERWRVPIESVFGALDIPFGFEGSIALGRTPFGRALLGVLRFAWLDGERRDLFTYLRSPYSGISRAAVDFVEGRLRGRGIAAADRVEQEAERLRNAPLPVLASLRAAESPTEATRVLAAAMLENAYGLEGPPANEMVRQDLRCHEALRRILRELEGWAGLAAGEPSREDVLAAAERTPVQLSSPGDEGRVAVLDLLRARTRRFEVVFVLGLEEGSLPRRRSPSPFLDEDARVRLGGRLQRPDQIARDRYLFYTACTRASRRLVLVREAATDDGVPREASPFWHEVRVLFDQAEVERWTSRRPLSALSWPVEAAPTERERLRAVALLHPVDGEAAEAIARANGWERRLERARHAFSRPTRLRQSDVLAPLQARSTFNVTELERFADCSSAWFVERLLDPKTIDADVDAKLRGGLAHTALHRFFSGLPKELGTPRVEPARVEDAVRFMRRCLDDAISGVRMDMTDMQRRELDQTLWRDLEAFVRAEAESELPLEPRRFEIVFGSDRASPELQRGLDLGGVTLSGRIDRIDVDPRSAQGLVIDYKSGKGAHSAQEIEQELRLQIPLYMLVLRDLVGVEPLGGVYRPLGGDRRMRGILRAELRDELLPGFARTDYLDNDTFWGRIERARRIARDLAERIQAGDVQHDPRGGDCPSWCDLWPMCRVRRA
jgi:ATP-dependent helicase/DNAse subunit B